MKKVDIGGEVGYRSLEGALLKAAEDLGYTHQIRTEFDEHYLMSPLVGTSTFKKVTIYQQTEIRIYNPHLLECPMLNVLLTLANMPLAEQREIREGKRDYTESHLSSFFIQPTVFEGEEKRIQQYLTALKPRLDNIGWGK